MKLNDLYPSRFLKADDLDGKEVTYTISDVAMEEIGQERERKPVLSFKDSNKSMVLNKTNGLAIAAMYGEDTKAWAGKAVTLKAVRVPFGGKLVDSIRVKQDANPGDSVPF